MEFEYPEEVELAVLENDGVEIAGRPVSLSVTKSQQGKLSAHSQSAWCVTEFFFFFGKVPVRVANPSPAYLKHFPNPSRFLCRCGGAVWSVLVL